MEMTPEQLTFLIAAGESETLEFKESFGDEAIESIGAFANARGGVLLVGIKDSGEIIGFQIGKKTLEEIANRIQSVTDPRLQPSFSVVQCKNRTVLVVHVAVRTAAPVSVRGRYFRRVAKTNQRMSHEEIMQALIASTGLSWDAFVETSMTLEDLDFERINRFIADVRKVGLLQEGMPTRAAVLLFGRNPGERFSSAFLKIGRFRSPVHIVDDLEAHGTLIDQLDMAMNWFRGRLATEFSFTGSAQREIHWEYPLNAIREALINALCHRDYTSAAHSQIRLYDDRLEIWNPGSLPSPLTPEMLLEEHDSIPRNRKIAEVFFYAGLIERWGSGTLRMGMELKEAGLPEPRFDSKFGRFQVTFCKKSIPKVESYSESRSDLSNTQMQAIRYVKDSGSISNAEYQQLAKVSKRTASRELKDLMIKEIFIPVDKQLRGPGVRYKLVE